MRILEYGLGRRVLWRIGRLIYFQARRDGYNDPEINGEYALHRKFARFARDRGKVLTVVDVGGFTGYWSRHLLKTCHAEGVEGVRLWIFEPSAESRAKLADRIKSVSAAYCVTIRPEAVFDRSGEAVFDNDSSAVGNQRLLSEGGAPSSQRGDKVTMTTLAEIATTEGLEEIDYVKSDVEGYDLGVVRGAIPLLKGGRIGVLQFEYNHCWIATRSFLQDVFDIAASLPYRVCKIVPEGLESYAAWNPVMEAFVEANFALVRNDLLQPLGVREGSFDQQNTFGVP